MCGITNGELHLQLWCNWYLPRMRCLWSVLYVFVSTAVTRLACCDPTCLVPVQADIDELFTLKNHFFIGNFQVCGASLRRRDHTLLF